ncbi:hypothetical protein [Aureivirga sp. CE67]|uniref:hypothetical protein n=1 Tax=Aureivirga sp. CE67 TaxID=1788983 RepID=UPI0018CA9B35|nr:hypothetical protein [Aureivirga sp. CE67]
MKRFLHLLIFISICSFGQNQNSTSLKLTETDSLYLTSIKKYIVLVESNYNKVVNEKQPKTIFVEDEDYLYRIPDSVNGYRIQKFSLGDSKLFKKNNKELRYVKIFPLEIDKGKFKIPFVHFFAKLKKRNHLVITNINSSYVFFEFKNGHLIYDRTEK